MLSLRQILAAVIVATATLGNRPAPLKIYRHVEDGAPRSLDPALGTSNYANRLITAVYDTLYEYCYLASPFALKPNLAAAMPTYSADRLTVTIPLKRGVLFQDDPAFPGGRGREVTADDFVYSLKRLFDPALASPARWLWQGRVAGLDDWSRQGARYGERVPGLQVVDRYTVKLQLSQPFPQLLYALAMGSGAVVPREAIERYGTLSQHTVGSGPWRLVSFDTRRAILDRNPTYRKEIFHLKEHGYVEAIHGFTGIRALEGRTLPLADRVEVEFVRHPATHWAAFLEGTGADYTRVLPAQARQIMAGPREAELAPPYRSRYFARTSREHGVVFFAFNMADPRFGDHPDPAQAQRNRALRCAIRKAYDWEDEIKALHGGLGRPFPGVIPPMVDGFDPELSRESVTLDLAGARALLRAHGWNAQNLPAMIYGGDSTATTNRRFGLFRRWMAKIGYPAAKIRLRSYSTFGDYLAALHESELPGHWLYWSLDYPDAENILQVFYGPNKAPGSNASNYQNPEYDRLYERASRLAPGPERTKLYRQANQLLIDDCVVISGLSRVRIHIWGKNLIAYPRREVLGNFFKYAAIR